MSKYENETWKLLNVEELPRRGKSQIDYLNCIGLTLKYELKANGTICEIKIVDYIPRSEENKYHAQFKVEYIFLKGTKYEEVFENSIQCGSLINEAKVGGIISSLNQWVKKDNYWIGIDTKGREFKFSTNDKQTEYKILHSTWCIDGKGYVLTNSLNNTNQKWQMHRATYFDCNKKESDNNKDMCVDHINNSKVDNRIDNLRLVTKAENNRNKSTNSKLGLVGLKPNGKGYCSKFMLKGCEICTKTKYKLEEAKLDNLITQRYLGFRHNEDQFYKLNKLSEGRIKEVTDLLDKKIKNNKHKGKKEKEYCYDFIEKDDLIGIETFKKDGTPNEICWVDRDFGKIEGDKFIIKGHINNNKGYFNIKYNRINVYITVGEISLQNYRNNNFQIDHINHNPNDNYRDNLEIVTNNSNMMNQKNRGYAEIKRKKSNGYQVKYANNWKYFDLYIGGLKNPTFDTEEEAITEYQRRKEIVDKYRFRIGWQGSIEANIKALDEIIDFAEEHELDIDSAYIVWAGLDTLENIKNI